MIPKPKTLDTLAHFRSADDGIYIHMGSVTSFIARDHGLCVQVSDHTYIITDEEDAVRFITQHQDYRAAVDRLANKEF